MSVLELESSACDLTDAELRDGVAEFAAHLCAATCRFLEWIGELDRRGAWAGVGVKSCAHWLNWRCGIGLVAAREKVRVARKLPELPKIHEAFAAGRVSYSKVRAMIRVATPADEDYYLHIANSGTASHVEKLVRKKIQRDRLDAPDAPDLEIAMQESRSLSYRWDDDGMLVLRGRLPAAEGALLLGALEQEPTGDSAESPALPTQRRADALVEAARALLASEEKTSTSDDPYLVMVHVDVQTLSSGGEHSESSGVDLCELDHASGGGASLSAETARRLCCEGGVVTVLDGDDGNPLDVGRKTRVIPRAIRRALAVRDKGCRFPGCTHQRFLHAHHMVHWAHGGETSLANTVQLCSAHHVFVHERGFGVANEDGEIVFRRPDGARLLPCPPLPVVEPEVASLQQSHRAKGLDIHPWTLSGWGGETMDYDLALGALAEIAKPSVAGRPR